MPRPKASRSRSRAASVPRGAPRRNGSRNGSRTEAADPRGVRRSAKDTRDTRTVTTAGAVISRLRPMAPLPVVALRVAARPAVAVKTKARPLTKDEVKEFRRLLEEERRRLSAELRGLEERIPQVEHQLGMDVGGSYDEDFADVAGDTFEREKGFAIESSVQGMLRQVEEALDRLGKGQYGICEYCGNPIHPPRLRALPYAKLCIDCKAREERANGGRS